MKNALMTRERGNDTAEVSMRQSIAGESKVLATFANINDHTMRRY
jgi:hypothetical protein